MLITQEQVHNVVEMILNSVYKGEFSLPKESIINNTYKFSINEVASWIGIETETLSFVVSELCSALIQIQVSYSVNTCSHFELGVVFNRVGYRSGMIYVTINKELPINIFLNTTKVTYAS
ncbi:hypothetical protein [Thaumasiovibrio subtropicus]|uniref:hypothetical protein n=1 Tax=Thaumasiovibrio subtropicus TaxID=1891207 RepID=UPI000B35C687|nr:hypothetical protein [Thaumasiovibrio subtropicus]